LNYISTSILIYLEIIYIGLTLIIIVGIIFRKNVEYDGLKYILKWISLKIDAYLRTLIELDLILSVVIVFLSNSNIALAFISFSIVINLFSTFFLQDYTIRKDFLCCKSLSYLMIFKISLVIGYVVNTLSCFYSNNQQTYMAVILINLVLSSGLFFFYLKSGFMIYRNNIAKIGI
jgi:hypothetical protein